MINFFYDLFYMLPLGIALILSALGINLVSDVFMPPVSACIVCSLFIILLLALRHCGKKERLLIGGILIVALVTLFLILGNEKREILYSKFSWTIAVFAISIIAIIAGRIAENVTAAKITVSAILLAGVVYMMVTKAKCPKSTLGFCIAVIMIYLMELVQRSWHKSGYTDIKSHVARIAPILMLIAIVTISIPTPSEKFQWKIAQNLWKTAVTEYKRIVGMITANKEEYVYAGFSDNGVIKGGISESGREVMLVTCDSRSFDRLYMSGITYENFDGKQWSTQLKEESDSRELDYAETRAALCRINPENERDILKIDNITVTNKLFNTKYLFIPAKTNMQSNSTELPKHTESGSELLTAKKIKYEGTYKISYMQLNFNNPDLIEAINVTQPYAENEWNEALLKYHFDSDKRLEYERYLAYRDEIYETYGGNPNLTMEEALENAQLSDEVKAIVGEAISSDKAKSDYERLEALAEYLQTMNYSKNVEKLPKKVNDAASYLDYFMLETQSGYCVHYATAFTLLARQLGYPARYVQGYYIVRENGATETVVTENKAHAWAEVYFDNFGWVTFEATPGYAISKGWAVAGHNRDKKETGYNPSLSNINVENTDSEEQVPEPEKKRINILYFVIPLICAVIFGMIYLLIFNIMAEKKYRKMNAQEKVLSMIGKNMRILKILGYPFEEYVTVEEYKNTVSGNILLAETVGFLILYEKMLYSDYTIDKTDVAKVEHDYELLMNTLKLNRGKYILYRMVAFT